VKVPFFPFMVRADGNGSCSVVVADTERAESINHSAARLLELCDGYRTINEIARVLSTEFSGPFSVIESRLRSFVDEMDGKGLIWIREERMRWFRTPPPSLIFWEITAECNLRCKHCVVSADKKLQQELTTDEALMLVDEWARLGVQNITFSGGEPLLRPDMFEIARYAKSQNINLQIATNGTLVTPSVVSELKSLAMDVQISLDGSSPEVYGRFRGNNRAFYDVVRGIEALRAAGMNFTLATVVTKSNVQDIPNILKLVEQYGIQAFRLIPFIPLGRGKKNKNLELEPSEMKELTVYLRGIRKKAAFDILPMEFEETLEEPFNQRIDPADPSACGGAIHYTTVTPEGCVLPCHYFYGVKTENVHDHSFSWIWHNSRFLNYFRSLRIRDFKGGCAKCKWLAQCRTGCKAANFSAAKLFEGNRHCWIANGNEVQTTDTLSPDLPSSRWQILNSIV
jgi:radical SAM protein with 4Fe4S-binding SPASM domain